MPPPMDLDDDIENADENYHESSDEDFNPEGAPADESESSDDNDEAQAAAKTTKVKGKGKGKGKRKAVDDAELDSGDEVTIEAARKRKSKKRKGAKVDDDDLLLSDDEGDEGGLIKTRAQRKTEQKERKPLARTDGATVDVDALWAQMTATPLKPLYQEKSETTNESKSQEVSANGAAAAVEEEAQVTVKKVYTFAGQRTEEEKQIPRSSLDKYISDGWKAVDVPDQATDADGKAANGEKDRGPKIRRPLRRPSRFDPNPTGYVRALPPEFQLTWPRKSVVAAPTGQENAPGAEAPKAKLEKAQKLNVVDKSRLDWTGFVDKEGIADELDTHGKTKEAYMGRMQFLAGVEARREEERRKAKTSATAS